MDEVTQEQKKHETSAREWLVLLAVGLVMVAIGASSDYAVLVPLGLLLAGVCAFGIAWRLLGKR